MRIRTRCMLPTLQPAIVILTQMSERCQEDSLWAGLGCTQAIELARRRNRLTTLDEEIMTRTRSIHPFGIFSIAVLVILTQLANAQQSPPTATQARRPTVLFLCPHGAAKS